MIRYGGNFVAAVVLSGLLAAGAFPASRLAAAEQLFTQDVRIQKAASPKLIMEGNGSIISNWEVEGSHTAFRIRNAMTNTVPFRILPGAPTHSLYIESNGFVGLGTHLPAANLHVADATLDPLIRLQTLGGGGQIWDVSGGHAGLFVADATSGRQPFSVEPGTPDHTLHLSSLGTGHVGVGTTTPNLIGSASAGGGRHLNLNASVGEARAIVQGQTAAEWYIVHKDGAVNKKIVRARVQDGRYFISTVLDNLQGTVEPFAFTIKLNNGFVGLKTGSPVHPLQVGDAGANDGNGARVTTGGVWTNASSRSVKQDIHPLDGPAARDAVLALQPVRYRYKNEPAEEYIGFIAEDVPDLVATRDRKSLAAMDITAVLARVIQDQAAALEQQRRNNNRLRTTCDAQRQVHDQRHRQLDDQQARIEHQQSVIERQDALLERLGERLRRLVDEDGNGEWLDSESP